MINTEISKYYESINRAVKLLNEGYFNGLFICGKAGTGKSFSVDNALNEINADYVVFRGEQSEPKFFSYLQENNGKIIVFRDISKLLRKISFIDTLKAITENVPHRIISRHTYAEHNGVEPDFEFIGKVILEVNDISKRYKEDLESLFSRGIYIDFNLSYADLTNLMFLICSNNEQKEVTKYLIDNFNILGANAYNLRTQDKCFKIYQAAIKDNIDWKKQIDIYIKTDMSEPRKLLYRFAGFSKVKRMDFVKFLMKNSDISFSTAERRINDWLYLEEIYSNGKQKQAILSLAPINISSQADHLS
jgi:hypothetical protein